MQKPFRAATICMSLFFPLFLNTGTAYCGDEQDAPAQAVIEEQAAAQKVASGLIARERLAMLPVKKIIAEMRIKPGMRIVDIGAGMGLFSFPLAEATGNTGVVYALDIYEPGIKNMEREAAKKGYGNLKAVLAGGVYDTSFFKQHTFDIIFVCDTMPYIWRMGEYFDKLRPSLASGEGRLYVIEPRIGSPFTELDLGDLRLFSAILKREGENFPVFQKLSPAAQEFIRQSPGTAASPEIQKTILADLNALFTYKDLFSALIDYYFTKKGTSPTSVDAMPVESFLQHFDTNSARLIRYLVTDLDETGAFAKDVSSFSADELERLKRLNKLILGMLFQINSLSFRQEFIHPTKVLRTRKAVITALEMSGYELVADHDILPKYYFLEFKRRD